MNFGIINFTVSCIAFLFIFFQYSISYKRLFYHFLLAFWYCKKQIYIRTILCLLKKEKSLLDILGILQKHIGYIYGCKNVIQSTVLAKCICSSYNKINCKMPPQQIKNMSLLIELNQCVCLCIGSRML